LRHARIQDTITGAAAFDVETMNDSARTPSDPEVPPSDRPAGRPLERFWPYAELPEQPTDEELAALDPELAAALFGRSNRPFSLTFVFSPFEGPDYARAVAMAQASDEYRETGAGASRRHLARFSSADVERIRELWAILGRFDASEVLVDDQPVPYARELWLPLLWLLLR
jgi:hypothetical protein